MTLLCEEQDPRNVQYNTAILVHRDEHDTKKRLTFLLIDNIYSKRQTLKIQ